MSSPVAPRASLSRSVARNKSYVDLTMDSDDEEGKEGAVLPLQASTKPNQGTKRKRVSYTHSSDMG